MSLYCTVTLEVSVHDKEALFKSAMENFMSDNTSMSEPDGLSILKPDGEIDVAACLQQILDPGAFPGEGASIVSGSAVALLDDGEDE